MIIVRSLICLAACLFFTHAAAQDVIPYERLDSLSENISRLEQTANGGQFIDIDSLPYEVAFPQESFKVWSYNRQATRAIWNKDANGDTLLLSENIDMSQATAVWTNIDYNGVIAIVVNFPKESITTQKISNGNTYTAKRSYLDFYCKYGKLDANKQFMFDNLFHDLYTLIYELKIEKGLLTKEDVSNELQDWETLSNVQFISKYPSSILTKQAKRNIAEQRRNAETKAREEIEQQSGEKDKRRKTNTLNGMMR